MVWYRHPQEDRTSTIHAIKEGSFYMSDKQMKGMIEFMDEKGSSDKEILDCFRRMFGADPSPSDQIQDKENES